MIRCWTAVSRRAPVLFWCLRANGPDHVDVLRAANAGHLGAECLGDLNRKRSEASRRSVDQDLLTCVDLSLIAKQLESCGCGHSDGRGSLEREVGGLHEELILPSARVLGKGTRAPAENLIAGSKLSHVFADCLNCSGDVRSRNPVLWLAQPDCHARDVRLPSHTDQVADMD